MSLRQTKQKELLEREMQAFKEFFTADELFAQASKKDDSIGIATVYRFLKAKKEKHELHAYQCNRRTLYSKGESSHCHFHCTVCGTMSHFSVDKIDFVKKKLPGSLCHFQLDVHGVCDRCK